MAGRFIVFDGPDGSGTTLHAALLADRLRAVGIGVFQTREPTDDRVGADIRRYLDDGDPPEPATLQLLFCADRADHVARAIRPALERGQHVICDRYRLSTIVYGTAQGLDEAWLRAINDHFPAPDITIVTLPPFDVCAERLSERDRLDPLEQAGLQRLVYDGYAALQGERLVIIDTSGPKEKTSDTIWEHVEPLFKD